MGPMWVTMYFRGTRACVRLDISVIIVRGVRWTIARIYYMLGNVRR